MIIYYDASNQFELTDDEFKNALPAFEAGKNVWVERLQVHLTPFYKWAGVRPDDQNEVDLGGGLVAIKKFGSWVNKNNPDVKIDLHYYPQLAKDNVGDTKLID